MLSAARARCLCRSSSQEPRSPASDAAQADAPMPSPTWPTSPASSPPGSPNSPTPPERLGARRRPTRSKPFWERQQERTPAGHDAGSSPRDWQKSAPRRPPQPFADARTLHAAVEEWRRAMCSTLWSARLRTARSSSLARARGARATAQRSRVVRMAFKASRGGLPGSVSHRHEGGRRQCLARVDAPRLRGSYRQQVWSAAASPATCTQRQRGGG